MRRCYAGFRSLTLALKGKQVLEQNAIYSEVVKKDPKNNKKGCSYALVISCAQKKNCENLLEIHGISYLGMVEE